MAGPGSVVGAAVDWVLAACVVAALLAGAADCVAADDAVDVALLVVAVLAAGCVLAPDDGVPV